MAFAPKKDRCGLSAASEKFRVRDDELGGSVEKYQPQGADGSFSIGTEIYGEDSAPKNTYALAAPGVELEAGKLSLGSITEVDGKKFALESITVATGAGSVVTVSASSKEIEADATIERQSTYPLPAFKLTTKQIAQILFGAFTLSGKGCNLTACSATIGCTVGVDKIAGEKISSDCHAGIITVTGTILRSGKIADHEPPVITPKEEEVVLIEGGTSLGSRKTSKWVLTKPPEPTEKNPETSYQTYDFEVQLPLVKA
jgi:hypothetical protein